MELNESAERKKFMYVAENDEGLLIGVAMGGPERSKHPLYTAEIYILYLLPSYHRQGIGQQLIVSVVERLIEQGLRSLLIRVLKANNPARRFYEVLGGNSYWKNSLRSEVQCLFGSRMGGEM